jgi:hypothetical protein
MMLNAIQLSVAGAALDTVASEVDLMLWHDEWMSSAEYAAMADDDAKLLEELFSAKSRHLAALARKAPIL